MNLDRHPICYPTITDRSCLLSLIAADPDAGPTSGLRRLGLVGPSRDRDADGAAPAGVRGPGHVRGSWCDPAEPAGACLVGSPLALAAVQLAPLPGRIARRLSPRSHAIHSVGVLPDLARTTTRRRPCPSRSHPGPRPASIGRRPCAGCSAPGLPDAVLRGRPRRRPARPDIAGLGKRRSRRCSCSRRSGWSSSSAGPRACTGPMSRGRSPSWAPSVADQMAAPGQYVLERLDHPDQPRGGWVVTPQPCASAAVGGLMGGPGAYLALAAPGPAAGSGTGPAWSGPAGRPGVVAELASGSTRTAAGSRSALSC